MTESYARRPRSRRLNARFRGPQESRKFNEYFLDTAVDLTNLARWVENLESRLAGLGSRFDFLETHSELQRQSFVLKGGKNV